MNRAERRSQEASEAASEAGRVLQAQGQTKAAESVVDDAPPPAAPKLDDTRERMMEGLYQGRKKAAAKATDPADMPPGLPPEDAAAQQTDDERAEAARAQKAEKAREDAAFKAQKSAEKKPDDAVQQEGVVEPPVVSATSKQKVDGVEYDAPLEEIEEAGSEKAWRLNKAAENRLAKSNEVVAKAQQQQAAITAWMQANAPKPAPKPSEHEVLQKLAANRFGTDDEFAAMFKDAIGQLVPQVDQNSVILQTTASIKRDNANAKFAKDFSDVLANPVIKQVAAQLEMNALGPHIQNGVPNWARLAQLDWDNFYSTIGTQVRGALGQRQPQPTVAPAANASGNSSQLSEKEARKASIVNLPQAAAARAAAPAEDKPETREDALNRMRKSRGIPTG